MPQSEGFRQVTILSGQTDSEEIAVPGGYDMVGVLAPDVLLETVKVKVAGITGGTYRTLQSGAADIVITADKAVVFTQIPFSTFRLSATVGTAAGTAALTGRLEEAGSPGQGSLRKIIIILG